MQDDFYQATLASYEVASPHDAYYLREALKLARKSKDPRTKVGCLTINPYLLNVEAHGWNTLPYGIDHTEERLNNRDLKLKLIVHAEMANITMAARIGRTLNHTTLYLAATDDSGDEWGGPPCIRCLVHVIEAGIRRIVTLPQKRVTTWQEDLELSRTVIKESSILFNEYVLPCEKKTT